jgi:hypothetical protein
MKNMGSPSAKRRRGHQGVVHRPSELNPDVKTRKSLDVPVKWVMKNTNPAAALARPAVSERFSSPC